MASDVADDKGAHGTEDDKRESLVAQEMLKEAQTQLQKDGNRDEVIHWWCQKTLERFLGKLRRCPNAGPFLEPLPWKELGLDDYLEVIPEPVDLKTIGERLGEGSYMEEDGYLNPEHFWEDAALCWENCKRYYDGEEDADAWRMAEEMRKIAEGLEDTFWQELDRFETSLDDDEDNDMAQARAALDVSSAMVEDVAAATIEDTSAAVVDIMNRVGDWWWGGRKGPDIHSWTRRHKKDKLDSSDFGTSLRDHYEGVILKRYHIDAVNDLNDIEAELHAAFDALQSVIEDIDQEDLDEDEGQNFPGMELKVPIHIAIAAAGGGQRRLGVTKAATGVRKQGVQKTGIKAVPTDVSAARKQPEKSPAHFDVIKAQPAAATSESENELF